jgi:hypothetical protein
MYDKTGWLVGEVDEKAGLNLSKRTVARDWVWLKCCANIERTITTFFSISSNNPSLEDLSQNWVFWELQ